MVVVRDESSGKERIKPVNKLKTVGVAAYSVDWMRIAYPQPQFWVPLRAATQVVVVDRGVWNI